MLGLRLSDFIWPGIHPGPEWIRKGKVSPERLMGNMDSTYWEREGQGTSFLAHLAVQPGLEAAVWGNHTRSSVLRRKPGPGVRQQAE